MEGVCTAKDGMCIAGSDGDCRQATICQKVKRCRAKEGACAK
jgi:hypothetical protein